jgi:class 3 adenylate cyclase
MGRYLAERIEGAKFVELPGADLFLATSESARAEIAEFLTGSRPIPAIDRVLATVLFTDIVGSTQRAVNEGDHRWAELLDAHHRAVRSELERYGGSEVDTAGDGFFVTFDGPARAIRCACAIRDGVDALGLQIRAGVHTGEVERSEEGLRGLAVHIGARVGAAAGPGEIFVSRTVADLVAGSGIALADRGEYDLKGVPGPWRLFSVEGECEPPSRLGLDVAYNAHERPGGSVELGDGVRPVIGHEEVAAVRGQRDGLIQSIL